ncbi:MAG: hypothetical protein WKF30_11115 [Pyrinomonadaceae bacterium]
MCPNLHVIGDDDRSELRKFVVTVVAAHVAEAVGPHHGAGVQNHAITDLDVVIQHHARVDHAVPANFHIISETGPA